MEGIGRFKFDQMFEGAVGEASAEAIEAIPTDYKGIHFRSRLEVRWAAFYDSLGVPWDYEPQRFDLGGGLSYLPDFWLPSVRDGGAWVEIKPKAPSTEEAEKARRLAAFTEREVFIFYGPCWLHELDQNSSVRLYTPDGHEHEFYTWVECRACGALGIGRYGETWALRCNFVHDKIPYSYGARSDRLVGAYLHARQMRFGVEAPLSQQDGEG